MAMYTRYEWVNERERERNIITHDETVKIINECHCIQVIYLPLSLSVCIFFFVSFSLRSLVSFTFIPGQLEVKAVAHRILVAIFTYAFCVSAILWVERNECTSLGYKLKWREKNEKRREESYFTVSHLQCHWKDLCRVKERRRRRKKAIQWKRKQRREETRLIDAYTLPWRDETDSGLRWVCMCVSHCMWQL